MKQLKNKIFTLLIMVHTGSFCAWNRPAVKLSRPSRSDVQNNENSMFQQLHPTSGGQNLINPGAKFIEISKIPVDNIARGDSYKEYQANAMPHPENISFNKDVATSGQKHNDINQAQAKVNTAPAQTEGWNSWFQNNVYKPIANHPSVVAASKTASELFLPNEARYEETPLISEQHNAYAGYLDDSQAAHMQATQSQAAIHDAQNPTSKANQVDNGFDIKIKTPYFDAISNPQKVLQDSVSQGLSNLTQAANNSGINFQAAVNKTTEIVNQLHQTVSGHRNDEPSLDMQEAASEHVKLVNKSFEQSNLTPQDIAHRATLAAIDKNIAQPITQGLSNIKQGLTTTSKDLYKNVSNIATAFNKAGSNEEQPLLADYEYKEELPLTMQQHASDIKKSLTSAKDAISNTISNPAQAASDFKDQTVSMAQGVVNSGANFGMQALGETINALHRSTSTPATPGSTPLIVWSKESEASINNMANIGELYLHGALKSRVKASTESQDSTNSFYTPNAETLASRAKTTDAVIFHAMDKVARLISPEESNSENSTKQPDKDLAKQNSTKPIEDFTKSILEAKEAAKQSKSTLKTSSVSEYLIHSLQKTAKNVRGNVNELKSFINKPINWFSQTLGLSAKETNALQVEGSRQIDILMKDQTSWFYATDATFNVKFNTWMESVIERFNALIGKNKPTDIQIIQINKENNDPLVPKITINRIKDGGKIISATVEYNGKSYNVPDIKPDGQGGYTIKTPLYTQHQDPFLIKKAIGHISNSIVDSIITPLKESRLFNDIEDAVAGKTKAIEKVLTKPSDGEFTITIKPDPKENDPTNSVITTSINKTGVSTKRHVNNNISTKNAGTIITEKIYTKNEKPNTIDIAQSVIVQGLTGDTLAPTIKIDYLPDTGQPDYKIKGNVTISYTNPMTNKSIDPIEIDLATLTPNDFGTYKIIREFKKDNSQSQLAKIILDKVTDPAIQEKLKPKIKIIEKALSRLSTDAYEDIINNLEGVPAFAMLKLLDPQIYEAAKNYLLNPGETGIESVMIEFNPKTGQIATRVVKTMQKGPSQKTDLTYTI